MNKKTLWITRTAVFVALLIAAQAATSPFGNQFVTGSIVNLILAVSAIICGLASGLTVAAISPIFAKLIGIGPLWTIIPFIMLGNMTLVLIWNLIGKRVSGNRFVTYGVAAVVAAVAKFLVLYAGVVHIAVPLLLDLPAKQAETISGMFSIPQLITALIGGAVAAAALPALSKAIGSKKEQ